MVYRSREGMCHEESIHGQDPSRIMEEEDISKMGYQPAGISRTLIFLPSRSSMKSMDLPRCERGGVSKEM